MKLLQEFAHKLDKNPKTIFIHVFGDSMLDEDYKVQVNRISPECPNVHILNSEEFTPFRCLPGGAANVCYQLNNFNVISRLFTFIDFEAYLAIRKHGVKYWAHIDLPENSFVPRKKRCYDKGKQVVTRWDIEKPKYGLESVKELQDELVKVWQCFQAEPDAIIFSDYNKGLFTDFKIDTIQSNAIKIVDPKTVPLDRWVNCTVFKPNSTEAEVLSGEKDWQKQCDFFKRELNCKAVVITQEGDGVVGKESDYFEYRPNCHIKPTDIIGAGDCFIGILSLALIHGFTIPEAAQIAFHGGLMYVQQKQRGMFGPWSFHSSGKILGNYDFLKDRDYKLAMTNGCFDLMHSGHLHTLEFAKAQGDKLLVAVNSDDSIKRLKGDGRPVLSLEERVKLLAALDCVDFVVSFKEDTPFDLIKNIKPDVLIKGEPYTRDTIAGAEFAKEIIIHPRVDNISTSDIINKCRK